MKLTTVLIGEVPKKPFNSYYLLKSQTEIGTVYGILVSNKNDECRIPGLFDDIKKAEWFVAKMLENNVGPLHLINVVDDYFCEV